MYCEASLIQNFVDFRRLPFPPRGCRAFGHCVPASAMPTPIERPWPSAPVEASPGTLPCLHDRTYQLRRQMCRVCDGKNLLEHHRVRRRLLRIMGGHADAGSEGR